MKKWTIIADSCCDLRDKDLTTDKIDFYTVPLTITLGEVDTVDEEGLDTVDFVNRMKANKGAIRTACPSPEAFADKMRLGGNNIICITISSKLSGTYNSARLAAETVMAENPDKKIYILDSLSASAGMLLLCNKLKAILESSELGFEEAVEKIVNARDKTKVRFTLQDLGNFIKTGRLNKIVGLVLSTLAIKPILGDNGEGEIKRFSQHFGFRRAVQGLAEFPAEKVAVEGKDIPVVITHCHNEEDAGFLKKLLESKFGLTNIKTYLMRGLSSFFANDKGVLLAY